MGAVPPSESVWQRLAALDARCDLTLHRGAMYPPGTRWHPTTDAHGVVRSDACDRGPVREWVVTVRLRAGMVSDFVQARAPGFEQAAREACAAAEARGWHAPPASPAPSAVGPLPGAAAGRA